MSCQSGTRLYLSLDLKKWWPFVCSNCHYRGLSRDAAGGGALADTGDFDTVICPNCHQPVDEDNDYLEVVPAQQLADLRSVAVPLAKAVLNSLPPQDRAADESGLRALCARVLEGEKCPTTTKDLSKNGRRNPRGVN